MRRVLPQSLLVPAVILHPWRLAVLGCKGGFMLVYAHLGKGATGAEPVPPALEGRRRLADERWCRRIPVATVSRLLEFKPINRSLDWTCREVPEGFREG